MNQLDQSRHIADGDMRQDLVRMWRSGCKRPCFGLLHMPVPANQPLWQPLNLEEELIENSVAAFFVRVSGDSMIGSGIYPNDILVVDKAIEARNNHVVVAVLNGESTVKRLKIAGETIPAWICIFGGAVAQLVTTLIGCFSAVEIVLELLT